MLEESGDALTAAFRVGMRSPDRQNGVCVRVDTSRLSMRHVLPFEIVYLFSAGSAAILNAQNRNLRQIDRGAVNGRIARHRRVLMSGNFSDGGVAANRTGNPVHGL